MTTNLQHYDPSRPIHTLRDVGVQVSKSETSSSLSVEGVSIATASTAGERWEFTLPQPTSLVASFGKEGVLKKIVKLFSKELQVGDPTFDEKVYISTSDPDKTARFLQNQDVRNLIVEFVGEGGAVEIEGTKVMIYAVNTGMVAVVSEKDVARLVCYIMAFAG
jgi:hypothetical protein